MSDVLDRDHAAGRRATHAARRAVHRRRGRHQRQRPCGRCEVRPLAACLELRSPQSAATRSHRPPRAPDGRDITPGNQPPAASPRRRVTPAATAFSIVASVDWTRGSRRMRRCAGARLTDALLHSPERSGDSSRAAPLLALLPPSNGALPGAEHHTAMRHPAPRLAAARIFATRPASATAATRRRFGLPVIRPRSAGRSSAEGPRVDRRPAAAARRPDRRRRSAPAGLPRRRVGPGRRDHRRARR